MSNNFKKSSLVSLALLMAFSTGVFAQGKTDNIERNIEKARPVTSLKVSGGPGRISVESAAGIENKGEFTGVKSSLGVNGGPARIEAESAFDIIRGGVGQKGVSSSLDIEGGSSGVGVRSEFAASNGSDTKEISSSVSVGPSAVPGSGIGAVNSTFRRTGASVAGVFRRTPPQVLIKILQYKKIAAEMIAKQPAEHEWWSTYNYCTDLSGKWLPELQKRGMKAVLSATDSNAVRAFVIREGKEVQAYKFHVFLTDSSLGTGENEIIFDATYMQFLEGAAKLKGLPKIFIGTRHDAEKLFARYASHCRVEAAEGGDEFTGRYEIKSYTELIYSFGKNAPARQTFE